MQADKDKLDTFIKSVTPSVCPLCNNHDWGVASKLFYLGEFDKEGVDLRGARFPVLPITCSHCGYTMFISALVAGILDKSEGADR